jgi:hypothetical protein
MGVGGREVLCPTAGARRVKSGNHGSRKISSVSAPGHPPTSRKSEFARVREIRLDPAGSDRRGHGRAIPLPLVSMGGRRRRARSAQERTFKGPCARQPTPLSWRGIER